MLFVWFLLAILVAAAVHIGFARPLTFSRCVELLLLYLVVGYYGFCMLIAAYVQLAKPEAIAAYKGWPAHKPFQTLYAFALIGLGVSSVLSIWLRGTYILAPAVAGPLLSFGGAYIHIREMLGTGRFTIAKDGQEILFDVVIPMLILGLGITYSFHSMRQQGGT